MITMAVMTAAAKTKTPGRASWHARTTWHYLLLKAGAGRAPRTVGVGDALPALPGILDITQKLKASCK
jgi:hypothetical protein